jgi:formyltetrahydrofolate deformylase
VTATSWVIALSCPDQPGIVHAVSGVLAALGGNITESQQFGDTGTGRFLMRVEADVEVPEAELRQAFAPVVASFGITWDLDRVGRPVRTLVMVGTSAHCLNDLLFRQRSGLLPITVPAIVSNHTALAPLASFYDVPFHHVPVTPETKTDAEARMVGLVEELDVELVVLARYMQVLSDDVCRRLGGRMINIHHSFLPSFKGARPYAQAHDRGVKLIGATAHYVSVDLDEGPIIEQGVERVDHAMTVPQLVSTGQDIETQVLARAVRWHAEHRVLLDGHRTVVFR